MNTENLDYLKNGLKFTGFDTVLNNDLVKKISESKPQFKLEIKADFGKDQMEYTLHFRKSDQTDMYFYNRYDATLKTPEKKEISQTFYINQNRGITAKEAYNLLSGRAVHKTLINKQEQPYDTWLQLDLNWKDPNDNFKLKQFNQGYGYDLEKSLAQYPITQLTEPQLKERTLDSLKKGNLQKVTIDQGGSTETMYIQADPQFKTVRVYDHEGQPLPREVIENLKVSKRSEPKITDSVKQGTSIRKGAGKKKELNTSGDQKQLVAKKRTRQKKGLAL